MVSIIYQNNAVLHLDVTCVVGPGLTPLNGDSESNYIDVDGTRYGGNLVFKYTPGEGVRLVQREGEPGVTHNVEDLQSFNTDTYLVLEIAAGRFTPLRPLDGESPDVSTTHYSKQGVFFDLVGEAVDGAFTLHKTDTGYVTLPSNAAVVTNPSGEAVSTSFTTPIDEDLHAFTGNAVVINTGSTCYAVGEYGTWRVYVGVHATKTSQPLPETDSATWYRRYIGTVGRVNVSDGARVPSQPSYRPENFVPTNVTESYQFPSFYRNGRILIGKLDQRQQMNLCEFELDIPEDSGFLRALAKAFGVTDHLFAALSSSEPGKIAFEEWEVGLATEHETDLHGLRSLFIERGLTIEDTHIDLNAPDPGKTIVARRKSDGRPLALKDFAYGPQNAQRPYFGLAKDVVEITGHDGLPLVLLDANRLELEVVRFPRLSIGSTATFDRESFVDDIERPLRDQIVTAGRPDDQVRSEVHGEYADRISSLEGRIAELGRQLQQAGRPDAEVSAEWERRMQELRNSMVPQDQIDLLASVLKTTADRSLLDEISAVRELEQRASEGAGTQDIDYSPLMEYLRLKFGVALPSEYATKLREYITGKDNSISSLEASLAAAGQPDDEVRFEVLRTILDVITTQRVFEALSDGARRDPRQLALEITTLSANASETLRVELEGLKREVERLRALNSQSTDVTPGSPLSHVIALLAGVFVGKKIL